MTRAEALREARRRWGRDGFASYSMGGRPVVGCYPPFAYVPFKAGWSCIAATFEEAFADADRRSGGSCRPRGCDPEGPCTCEEVRPT